MASPSDEELRQLRKRVAQLEETLNVVNDRTELLIKMVALVQDATTKIDERTMRARSEIRQAMAAVLNMTHREPDTRTAALSYKLSKGQQ